MDDTNLYIEVIRNRIQCQTLAVENLRVERVKNEFESEILQTDIVSLEKQLVELDGMISTQKSAFTREQTLEFITNSDQGGGIQIKDIIKMYDGIEIKKHPHQIGRHIKELEANGDIVQTNPEVIRGKRYCSKTKSPDASTSGDFKTGEVTASLDVDN